MDIYASTSAHNTDPAAWEITGYRWQTAEGTYGYLNDSNYHQAMRLGESITYSPRPEFDQPRAHEGNPVLIAARENWDDGDPFGSAMAWLIAFQDHDAYEETPDMDNQIPWEVHTLVSLRTNDGGWTLPTATPEHFIHAERVMDRIVDVARANGLDY